MNVNHGWFFYKKALESVTPLHRGSSKELLSTEIQLASPEARPTVERVIHCSSCR